jgi:hypothetical protein
VCLVSARVGGDAERCCLKARRRADRLGRHDAEVDQGIAHGGLLVREIGMLCRRGARHGQSDEDSDNVGAFVSHGTPRMRYGARAKYPIPARRVAGRDLISV